MFLAIFLSFVELPTLTWYNVDIIITCRFFVKYKLFKT